MTRYPKGTTATAPRGRVTIEQAAQISGLSPAEVYRRCRAGLIPSAVQDLESRQWSIQQSEAEKLRRGWEKRDPRVAVSQIRVPRERYETWEREARRRGMTVRELLMLLADEASGWQR